MISLLNPLLEKENTSFAEEVLINNLRAYLYGYNGICLYDEPVQIPTSTNTYLAVTHHVELECNCSYELSGGRLRKVT